MTSAPPGISKEYKGETLPDEVCTAIDDYFASIDSARGLDKESAMNAISDAWEELDRVCAEHSKHPNFPELKQTLAQHLIALQLQAAFGKNMASQASKGELAIRDKLMRMCGK